MTKFFDFIVNFIGSIIDGFIDSYEAVSHMFTMMARGIKFLVAVIHEMPLFCHSALLAILSISILGVAFGAFIDMG